MKHPPLLKHIAMKTSAGVDVHIQAFLILALNGGEWSESCSGRFTSRKKVVRRHCIVDGMGFKAGLDIYKILYINRPTPLSL